MKDRLNVFTKKEAIASVNIDKDRITMTEERKPIVSGTEFSTRARNDLHTEFMKLWVKNYFDKIDFSEAEKRIRYDEIIFELNNQFINKDDPIALKQAGLVRIDDLKHFIKDKMYVLDPRYSNKPIVNSEDLFKFIELLGDK